MQPYSYSGITSEDITERDTDRGKERERPMKRFRHIYLSSRHKMRFTLFGNLFSPLSSTLPTSPLAVRTLPSPLPCLSSNGCIFLPESSQQPPNYLAASVLSLVHVPQPQRISEALLTPSGSDSTCGSLSFVGPHPCLGAWLYGPSPSSMNFMLLSHLT